LREDFCGTALLCSHLVKSAPGRSAVGLVLDMDTLQWAGSNNLKPLGGLRSQVQLMNCDVLSPSAPKGFDVICAFNFSYCVFHTRKTLVEYFKKAKRGLSDNGVFLLDIHGGPDAQFEMEEVTTHENFDYVWQQGPFDPINNRTVNRIHFRFEDGSEIKNAFVYDWRVWSLTELKDVLADAGFEHVVVWWDGEDNRLVPSNQAVNYQSWLAYVAAWKKK